jgi:hypothetical protein
MSTKPVRDNGKGEIQGSLDCVAHDEVVRCFGRDDVFGMRKGKDKNKSNGKSWLGSFYIPTLATMRLSRRWGTRFLVAGRFARAGGGG